jgi:hypothetical protein
VRLGWGCAACTSVMVQEEEEEEEEEEPTDAELQVSAHTLTGGAHGAGVRLVGTAVILSGNTAYRMRCDAQ